MPAQFPYERYETLPEPLTVYYPAGEEKLARRVFQTIENAVRVLTPWLKQPMPEMEVLVSSMPDWYLVPHEEPEEIDAPHPYWTDLTTPPSLVIPVEIDPTFGQITSEKRANMLYHELALAYLEQDPRPWSDQVPLWADEWQFEFVALYLSRTLDGQQGVINKDLHDRYADIFEPEADGKTPMTIRGFDWFEDLTPEEDFLCFELLLEQFADDLLDRYDPSILLRFLDTYRAPHGTLISEEVEVMLGDALGPGGIAWLENLVYF